MNTFLIVFPPFPGSPERLPHLAFLLWVHPGSHRAVKVFGKVFVVGQRHENPVLPGRVLPRLNLRHDEMLSVALEASIQGDPSGRFKPPVVIDLKVA